MIEVDLLKSGKKGRSKASGPVSAASGSRTARTGAHPQVGAFLRIRGVALGGWRIDGWVAASAAVVAACAGAAAYMAISAGAVESRTEAALDAALQDSVRRTATLEKMRTLEERREAVAARAAVIEELDAERYAWPRIMSEVARALPAEAWLVHLGQTASDGPVRLRMEGKATDNLAVARFWNDLEASSAIGTMQLVTLEHGVEERSGATRDVYHFVLEATQPVPAAPADAANTSNGNTSTETP